MEMAAQKYNVNFYMIVRLAYIIIIANAKWRKNNVYQSICGRRFRHAVCRIYGLYGVHSDRCFPDGDEKKKITAFLSFVR